MVWTELKSGLVVKITLLTYFFFFWIFGKLLMVHKPTQSYVSTRTYQTRPIIYGSPLLFGIGAVSCLVIFPRWQCQSPWGHPQCHSNNITLCDIYEWIYTPRNVWLLLKQFLLLTSFIWVGTSQQKCPCSYLSVGAVIILCARWQQKKALHTPSSLPCTPPVKESNSFNFINCVLKTTCC